MKIARRLLALLIFPLCASAAITVERFDPFDPLPVTLIPDEIYLQDVVEFGEHPTTSIRNLYHEDFYEECGGESLLGFARFRHTALSCTYFFRSTDINENDPALGDYPFGIESWSRVYWKGGDDELFDGAQWGSDNYLMMRHLTNNTIVAVLQFNFDQFTGASLVGYALDLDGLTFTEGVLAINAAAIPEPSTYAAIFGAVALGAVVIARRRQSKQS